MSEGSNMNAVLKAILGKRTATEALDADARAIREIVQDTRARTYDQKNDLGYVTAKILPVVRRVAAGK